MWKRTGKEGWGDKKIKGYTTGEKEEHKAVTQSIHSTSLQQQFPTQRLKSCHPLCRFFPTLVNSSLIAALPPHPLPLLRFTCHYWQCWSGLFETRSGDIKLLLTMSLFFIHHDPQKNNGTTLPFLPPLSLVNYKLCSTYLSKKGYGTILRRLLMVRVASKIYTRSCSSNPNNDSVQYS